MIVCGDNREALKQLADESVSLVATDPPYGIQFMHGSEGGWDDAVPGPEVWREVMRVLKPGGSCFVFTGARGDSVFGNLLSLREAGFRLDRQMLTWAFANGNMPKALDLSRDFDKSAFREWLASKPLGTQLDNEEAEVELCDDVSEEIRAKLSGCG